MEGLFGPGALFEFDWRLALVSLFVAPLFWLVARKFSRRIKQASREERRRAGSIGAVAEESLANAALVQAYNRQGAESARYQRQSQATFEATMTSARIRGGFSPLVRVIELLGAGERHLTWKFDFMGKSRWFFAMSGCILLIGSFAVAGSAPWPRARIADHRRR